MSDENDVTQPELTVFAPQPEPNKSVYETAKNLPPEKAVGAADVPAPVVVNEPPAPVHHAPVDKPTVEEDLDPKVVEKVYKRFDKFVVDRYGPNDQLVKLWRKHAEQNGVRLGG